EDGIRAFHVTGVQTCALPISDICADQGWPRWVGRLPPQALPPAVRRLCGRVPEGIDPRRVTAFPAFGLALGLRRLAARTPSRQRSEEHTPELQSRENLVCRLL